jgi:hypothetical protein
MAASDLVIGITLALDVLIVQVDLDVVFAVLLQVLEECRQRLQGAWEGIGEALLEVSRLVGIALDPPIPELHVPLDVLVDFIRPNVELTVDVEQGHTAREAVIFQAPYPHITRGSGDDELLTLYLVHLIGAPRGDQLIFALGLPLDFRQRL